LFDLGAKRSPQTPAVQRAFCRRSQTGGRFYAALFAVEPTVLANGDASKWMPSTVLAELRI
jgi:hypothetical protein